MNVFALNGVDINAYGFVLLENDYLSYATDPTDWNIFLFATFCELSSVFYVSTGATSQELYLTL